MSAAPTDFAARPEGSSLPQATALDGQWTALHEAADAVAALAGLATEKPSWPVRNFPVSICNAGGWRLDLAASGVADLAAMMTPGVKALLAVSGRGQDATAAALALWREFHHARAALLVLVPQTSHA